MLSSLTLLNFALFKKQVVEFQDNFNCLLGQSGAGKSIIISALSFVLGAKADKNFIRSGENSCRVDAVFDSLSKEALEVLQKNDLECDGQLVISRLLSLDGKSSIKVNGFPVALKTLQIIAEKLVDFCGQHDSVGLLNVSNHISFLDKFSGTKVEKQKNAVLLVLEELKTIKSKISALGGNEIEREREKDLLKFQIDEIENAHLELAEEDELKERFAFISSAEKIFEKIGGALDKLYDGRENVVSLLYETKNELSSVSEFKDIDECRERIDNAYYEIKDIAEVLEGIKQNTDFDPKELERIDARLELIKNLSKKYGKTVEDILNHQAECQKRLEELENSEQTLSELESKAKSCEAKLLEECEILHNLRETSAREFEKQICKQLEDVQMAGSRFCVEFERVEPGRNGIDNVKFLFSANKGQELKELHKTASGGELSRLLLAFKNVMLDKDRVQTLIFDEIDSGISGLTAGKVAEKLVNISKYTQIICITHTSVVASKANSFVLIEKREEKDNTISTAKIIDKEMAVKEVARLIDGEKEVSATAMQHAKNLFENK